MPIARWCTTESSRHSRHPDISKRSTSLARSPSSCPSWALARVIQCLGSRIRGQNSMDFETRSPIKALVLRSASRLRRNEGASERGDCHGERCPETAPPSPIGGLPELSATRPGRSLSAHRLSEHRLWRRSIYGAASVAIPDTLRVPPVEHNKPLYKRSLTE